MLTVLSGKDAGKTFHLSGAELAIGRGRAAQAALIDERVSRRHARLLQRADGVYVEDLGSRNGTFLGSRRIVHAERVRDGQRLELGDTIMKIALHDVHEVRAVLSLYESSVRDPLTGVYNRRHFGERLEAELSFSEQHRRSIAVLLIDIDLFKQINDRHGHPFADGVLKVVALTIQRMLRTEDVLARYGGDEFIVLARPMSHHNALILAQRIRKAIAALALSDGAGSVPVTVSIGIATSRTRETTEQCLTAAADRALYRSKRGGRDQIHVEPADELCAEQARALG